ncbi:MAG: response regulator [Gallionellaceae bacterium]|nr:response regulator [Gallionellaceae bacterium]
MIATADILNARILIVDDQDSNIQLLERILANAGYTSVSRSKDANEVCELQRRNPFDLILLDIEMPGVGFSGFQVMDCLREIAPDSPLPVIVITAHPDHKLHALQKGAMDFISKPFELPVMLARIRNMLEVSLLHQKLLKRIETLENQAGHPAQKEQP